MADKSITKTELVDAPQLEALSARLRRINVRVPVMQIPAEAGQLGAGRKTVAVDVGDSRLEIMVSFAARDGQLCREYSLSSAKTGQEIGIVCRAVTADTGWQLAFVASESAGAAAQGGYATASDRLHEAVDAFLGEHVAGEPFDTERERALIERGWTAN